jgi:glycosyltransferase involved in cell wall biosynthesis
VSAKGMVPRISIVTPSLNQADYLEHTLRSVLDQGYPNLEYVVVDGGSTDGSLAILDRYASRLTWSVSEPDDGHAAAINKGFSHTTGEIMAWLNSDDTYLPWTFAVVAEIFSAYPEVEWIVGTGSSWDRNSRLIRTTGYRRNLHDYLLGRYAWIQQESVFWRRSLWDRAGGGLSEGYRLAVDGELWSRFFLEARLHFVECVIGGFRHHDTNRGKLHFRAYVEEMKGAVGSLHERIPASVRAEHLRLRRLRAVHRRLPGPLRRSLARRFAGRLHAAGYDVISWTDGAWRCRREPFNLTG